jgi:hypothetical protein
MSLETDAAGASVLPSLHAAFSCVASGVAGGSSGRRHSIADGDAICRLATLRRAGLESELQRRLVLQSVRLLRELDVVLRRWL